MIEKEGSLLVMADQNTTCWSCGQKVGDGDERCIVCNADLNTEGSVKPDGSVDIGDDSAFRKLPTFASEGLERLLDVSLGIEAKKTKKGQRSKRSLTFFL